MSLIKIDLKDLVLYVQEYWHRRSTLVVLLLIVVIFSMSLFSLIKFEEISIGGWITISIILLSVILLWKFTTSIPKSSKRTLGFVVALIIDSKDQRKKIADDFLFSLKEILNRSTFRSHFAFIEFPQFYARKINSQDDALKYMNKSHSQFMIYGRAREREIKGEAHHVLNLHGAVVHHPIPIEISKKFSEEFSELFPQRLLISREEDIFKFEFTSEWINIVSKYIIGIAAFFSLDINYSQTLFEELSSNMRLKKIDIPAINKIKHRLPSRLTDVYLTQARINHYHWRQTRDPEILIKIKNFLDKLQTISPNNYDANLLRSIYYFVSSRDLNSAKTEIKKCENNIDATWRYSYAFLLAYEGDLKRSLRLYRSAFNHKCELSVPFETEEFIEWILEKEPDKTQLYFCLGLINYHAKEDYKKAKDDFQTFTDLCEDNNYIAEISVANDYLNKIRIKSCDDKDA